MKKNKDFTLLSSFVVIILCAGFGLSMVTVKISLSGISPFTAAGIRFSIAALTLAIWAKLTGRSFALQKGQFKKLLVLCLIFIAHLSIVNLGLDKTHASRGALIINLQPFIVLILAHFFLQDDSITQKKIISLLFGFAGIAVVFFDRSVIESDIMTGDFLIIISATLWGISATYTKSIIDEFKTFHLIFYPMMIGAPFFFIEGIIFDNPMIKYIDWKIIAAMFYQSAIAAAFGYLVWNHMLRRHGATALHSFVFIMPISGVLFSGLLIGEPITIHIIISLALITVAIWLLHFRSKTAKSDVPDEIPDEVPGTRFP